MFIYQETGLASDLSDRVPQANLLLQDLFLTH